jgi:hypothetical protein
MAPSYMPEDIVQGCTVMIKLVYFRQRSRQLTIVAPQCTRHARDGVSSLAQPTPTVVLVFRQQSRQLTIVAPQCARRCVFVGSTNTNSGVGVG